MITLALLAGMWTTTCIQTQISHQGQGFVKETYTFKETSDFEFKREWFKDPGCSEPNGVDIESGTIELGKKVNSFFQPEGAIEANFSSEGGVDLGAILIRDGAFIRVARGMKNSSMRNTMLGLFEYRKL